ncbi:MAG TPA: hypothetical protein VHE36_01280 [Sphingomicrobium sp.]|jgi:hypothetical protein|nr:hypothetical protein [Sphingomicrobium sp.]
MATIAERGRAAKRAGTRPKFYLLVGICVAAASFLGFYQSFYLNHWFETPKGMRQLTPLYLAHGTIFSLWLAFAILQPALIVTKKRRLHRRLGWAAVAVACAMIVIGNVAASEALNHGFAGTDPKEFYAVPVFDLLVFGSCVGLGVWWRERSETHKRLMLLSYTQLLHAAVGRWPGAWLAAGAPWSYLLLSDGAIIASGAAYDLVTRGKVHRVWIVGGSLVLLSEPLRMWIGTTAPWRAYATWVASLWPW